MCPFAVAGLALRYLRINDSDIFGHPFKKPFRVALRRVDIFGLHSDWWANLTLLARVEMECAKLAASCMIDVAKGGDGRWLEWIGSVHKLLVGSLCPLIIIFSL